MNWTKYFSEKDERKRWDMLQQENRLSYDHVDDWLMSLKYFLDIKRVSGIIKTGETGSEIIRSIRKAKVYCEKHQRYHTEFFACCKE